MAICVWRALVDSTNVKGGKAINLATAGLHAMHYKAGR